MLIIGHLACFWCWSLDHVKDGKLPNSSRTIARGAQWNGDSELFTQALITAKLIDVDDEGEYSIHDWMEYAGKLVDARERNAERMRIARAETKQARAMHVQCTVDARAGLPNQTVPNQTVPNQINNAEIVLFSEEEPALLKPERPSEFKRFWDTSLNKQRQKEAKAEWTRAIKSGKVTNDTLIQKYREHGELQQSRGLTVQYANRWINLERWNDEIINEVTANTAKPMNNLPPLFGNDDRDEFFKEYYAEQQLNNGH